MAKGNSRRMKFAFVESRRSVWRRGIGAVFEEAEEGVGGPAGINRDGIVATEEITAM